MWGVLVNTATVLLGSTIGLLFKKKIPERIIHSVMLAIGLCTLYIGISGTLKGENTLVLILSMALGTALGTLLDLDGLLTRLGGAVERKFSRPGERASVAQGFVTGSLLFCVGAMTIVGSLDAGLSGDNRMLYTKSLLDLISSCMLSASLGIGVLLAAAFVLVFQGALVLLSGVLAPLLTASCIAEITCAGSLMIVGLGLNLLGVTKLKIANCFPALLFAPLFVWLFSVLPISIG
jgi:uncharacterized membrane protein YqgA involved in biofilm formation